jgi:CheY-like chemotaxis protein
MLQASGATVRLVENGVEACAEVERKAPHLVLMDLQMPIMDGCEATRRLREGGLKAPILACTAHARPADLERCLAAGCDAVVTKPISVATLVQAVSAYARGVAAAPSGRDSGRVAGV